jgi:type III pantothenate kinase
MARRRAQTTDVPDAPVLLAIDIGNTNVTLGVFDYAAEADGRLAEHWRLATHRGQTSDEVAVTLRALFDQGGIEPARVSALAVSSVVPPLLPIWERVSQKLFRLDPLVVGPGVRTGMPVRTENPHEVGADRIVNAVAAFEWLGGPVIAVDFGTATTFDCVSERGEYLGGAIFPGMHVAMEALFERAAMLRRVELAPPRSAIGRTTAQAVQSGMLYGYAGMVDAMVERIRGELGASARVVATGGLASRVAEQSRTIERVEPFLTLEGLRMIFERNRSVPGEAPRREREKA